MYCAVLLFGTNKNTKKETKRHEGKFSETKGFCRFQLASTVVVLVHAGSDACWGWAISVACDIFMPN